MRNYFLTLFLLLTLSLFAQKDTYSPYSFYGIGLPAPQNGVFSQNMGGIGQGISNPNYINTANPASYAFNQKINFEFNIFGKLGRLQDSAGQYNRSTFDFGRMNLAFPLGKKKNAGACFGLAPYTSSEYAMSRSFTMPTAHTDYYNGNGGINKVFLGAGYSLNKYISIGANVNYLFGVMNAVNVTTFDSAFINNYYIENKTVLRGLNFDLGLQFKGYKNIIKDSMLYRKDDSVYVSGNEKIHFKKYGYRHDTDTIVIIFNYGMTWNSGSKANALRDVYGVTFKDFYLPFTAKSIGVKDTVKYKVDEKGKVILPGSLAVGFSISNLHKRDKRNTFLIGAEFAYSDWSTYRNYGNADSLHQSYTIRLGGYYKPLKAGNDNTYRNRIEYRLGGHYTRTPLMIRGTAINEYGVAIGFGLPVKIKNPNNPVALINVCLEAGKMGTLQNNLTTDSYLRLSLGLNLISDSWFHRYKYD